MANTAPAYLPASLATPSEPTWKKRLKLLLLGIAGVAAVSIPVTATVLFTVAGNDTLTFGNGQPTQVTREAVPFNTIQASLKACKPEQGYYALTFDGGPYPDTTERLVEALHRRHAVATFFNVGKSVMDHEDLVNTEKEVGQVANNSFYYPRFTKIKQHRRFMEMTETAKVLNHPNPFFRLPYGDSSPEVLADVATTQLIPVFWTVNIQSDSASTIVQEGLKVQPEGIIMLRDGRESTIQAVPVLVEKLAARGLCPGFLARTSRTVQGSGTPNFHVIAVTPTNDTGKTT